MTCVASSRTIIAVLIALILSTLLANPALAQPATQCGAWTQEASGPPGRFEVELIEDGGAECGVQVRLTNGSLVLGTLGGYGYDVALGGVDGARADWRTGLIGVDGKRGYLPHALTAELQLTPFDPVDASSSTLEIATTTESTDHDAALFLLKSVVGIAGDGAACQVSGETLSEIAAPGSSAIADVSSQAREFRYEQALLDLNRTLPEFLDVVATAAGNAGIECAKDLLTEAAKTLDGPGGLALVTRLGLELVTTLGKAAWDQFHAGAEPAVISLRYTPSTLEGATATPTPAAEPTLTPAPVPTAPLPTVAPTEASPPEDQGPAVTGEIAYVPYGQGEIWLRDLQAGTSEQITSGHEPWYVNVQFAPDGGSLLYVNSPVNLGDLYLRSFDTGEELAIDSQVQCATISPDGSSVAYVVLPSGDASGERVAVWMFDLGTHEYRLMYELNSKDLVALLGVDATSGAAVRTFIPEEHQQGCGLAWSAGDWLYLSLALDVSGQCEAECAGLPVTFRMNNGIVESLYAPVSQPLLDGLPQALAPIAGSLCLGFPTASLDGALAFTRCRSSQGSNILVWDAAGAWHEVSPGVTSRLSWTGDWLFIEQDGSLTCDGGPCQAGTVVFDMVTLEPLHGRIDGAQVTFRSPE